MKKTKTQIQDDVIKGLGSRAHGILLIAMRGGKSRIAIEQIKKEKSSSILWVTPNTDLRDKAIPAEFKKWKATSFYNKTDIICYSSLAKHTGSYDKIILDEIQFLTDANAEPLLNNNITYNTILGLTGTLPKKSEKLELYDLLNLKILKEITIDEAVELKLVSDYRITALKTSLDPFTKNIEGGNKQKRFMTTELSSYTFLDKTVRQAFSSQNESWARAFINKRMHFIYNLPSKLEAAKLLLSKLKGRSLCFSGSQKFAEALHKNVFHSNTDTTNLDLFKAGKIDILSCVNSGGVGHTFKNVDNVVIVQVNSNKTGIVNQKLARGMLTEGSSKANIYIIYCEDTVDQKWFQTAIEDVDENKVEIRKFKEFIKEII